MVTATIFVWEGSDWWIRKGYVCDVEKTNRIARLLQENTEWVESFDVSGSDLSFKDIEAIDEDELREGFKK